jgi:hypothetical protein
MSVIEFFEYLAGHEQSRELADDLADLWVSHQLATFDPAA